MNHLDRPASARFRHAHRLHGKREFSAVFREGRRFYGPGMIVVARVNGLGFSRLGLSVGRRIGGAVVRNRVKKRLRETFRCCPERHESGLDVVVIPRSADGLGTPASLAAEWSRILRKARRKLGADAG